ncbi:MAG: hypothetical protein D6732_08980 [Methanobacteriota archaeon]|nr:MAG: hypothetical protein D6732_08980 [Euryarchaeota archaeon]
MLLCNDGSLENMLRKYVSLLNDEDMGVVTEIIAEFRLLVGRPILVNGTEERFTINFDYLFELFVKNGTAEGMKVHKADHLPLSSFNLPNLSWLTLLDAVDPSLLVLFPQLRTLHISGDIIPVTSELIDDLKKLKLVSLRIHGVDGQIPGNLAELTTLQSLDLSYNSLEEVPSTLYGMDTLIELSLAYNLLRYFDPQWGDLKGLRRLNLRHNRLTTIHALARLPLLTEIDVSLNQLKCLSPDLRYLRHLRKLHAGGNPLRLKSPTPIF